MKTANLAVILGMACSSAMAQTWDGGGSDNFWATPENWNADVAPISTGNVVFGEVDKTTSDTPNSTVGASVTVRSLTLNNSGNGASDWQNIEIASGQTLTLSHTSGDLLLVGTVANLSTQAKIAGAGSLVLNGGTTANFVVRGATSGTITAYATPILDMSGLSSFTATVNAFSIGSNGVGLATATLGANNSVTANTLTIGSSQKNTSSGAGGNSVLNLGTTNILNVDSIAVGNTNSRTGGVLQFASTGGSVTIRGRAGGSSRADLVVAQGGDGSGATTNSANFSGNSVDALLDDLVVGGSSVGNTTITGNLSMDAGTVDATAVVVGRRTGNGSGAATGNLNVAGGALQAAGLTVASNAATSTTTSNGTLNVSGTGSVTVGTSGSPANLVMGSVAGTSIQNANANVNVTGGMLVVHGNIAEGGNAGTGTINSILTLNGGTVDVTGNSITVDTFNLQSGTLQNLGQFNGGADLVKTTIGTLNLGGTNSYTGDTVINAGTVNLLDNASLTFYIGANGINNALLGSGALSLDGDFIFDLSGAVALEGNSWLIVDVGSLAEVFGSTFTVQGFSESANVWTSGGYSFSEATGILSYSAVPEPSTYALLGLGLGALWLVRRRRC